MSDKNGKPVIKHNPAFYTEEELEALFVVRQAELDILLDIVRQNNDSSNQHVVIIAPRGMGKTMLVRRLAIAIKRDAELDRLWRPIVLPEDIYNISVEGELWLNVLERLAVEEGEAWKARFEILRPVREADRLRISVLAALKEYSEQCGKRLLIVVENFQMILGEHAAQDENWNLRKTLLNNTEIMLVATATTHFGEIENIGNANYELYREIPLKRLSTDDCRHLWLQVTGRELKGDQIRPMEILTGGSPRLLSILAGFAAELSLSELLDNLNALIDDHTPYFKAIVETLSHQERRVYVTLAELWQPAEARQVAEWSRLEINTTSAILNKLVKKGAVTEEGQEGRKKLYQIYERLYNIYYLLRLSGAETDRLRAFIRMLIPFYGPEKVLGSLACEAHAAHRDRRQMILRILENEIAENRGNPLVDIQSLKETLTKELQEFPEASGILDLIRESAVPSSKTAIKFSDALVSVESSIANNEWDLALEKINSLLNGSQANSDISEASLALLNTKKAFTLLKKGLLEESLAVSDDIIARFAERQETELAVSVANTIGIKSALLEKMGRNAEALDLVIEVITRFGERQEAELAVPVAMAMGMKGVQFEKMGRNAEALEAYAEVIARFAERQETKLAVQVVLSMVFKGDLLEKMGRSAEALEIYTEVFARFAECQETELAVHAAKAMLEKGILLEKMGKDAEALASFAEVITRFTESQETELAIQAAWALFEKGILLEKMGEGTEALEAFTEVIARFTESQETGLAIQAARVMVIKGALLAKMGRNAEALEAYADVITRFAEHREIYIAVSVARAMIFKGDLLVKMDRSTEALEAYTEVIASFAERQETELAVPVAMALGFKGALLEKMGKDDEALASFAEVIARFAERQEVELALPMARAMLNKGFLLEKLDKSTEALASFAEVIARFAERQEVELALPMARAMLNKGFLLEKLDKSTEALASFAEVIARFAERQETELAAQAAWAMICKGALLKQIGRSAEAMDAYAEMIARFAERQEVELALPMARAMLNKGFLLEKLDKSTEALEAYTEAIDRFGERAEKELQEQVAVALNGRAWMAYEKREKANITLAIADAERAISLRVDDNFYRHTLATLLGFADRWDEALKLALQFADDDALIKRCPMDITQFFIEAAAAGRANDALDVLKKTKSAKAFEPLVVALKIFAGKKYRAPREIVEMANDIVKKIKNTAR